MSDDGITLSRAASGPTPCRDTGAPASAERALDSDPPSDDHADDGPTIEIIEDGGSAVIVVDPGDDGRRAPRPC